MRFKHLKHIFFDLDHTLWDHDRNSTETLIQLYERYGLESLGLKPLKKFIDSFHRANLKVWDLFQESTINRHELRHKRLELVFNDFGLENQIIDCFHEDYYTLCSRSIHLINGAIEVLDVLKGKYKLHIITNGFDDAQYSKMDSSGLSPYFDTVTTSETAGSKKPEKEYFDFALLHAGAKKESSLVIGDGLKTDVAGAVNYGLDVIWFNDAYKTSHLPNVLEVRHLKELIGLLG